MKRTERKKQLSEPRWVTVKRLNTLIDMLANTSVELAALVRALQENIERLRRGG